jgi:adenylate cyclase
MVTLLVGVSAILIGLEYHRGREAALSDATDRMRAFSGRLVDRFRILFGDTVVSVGLASVSDVFADPPPERLTAKVGFLGKIVSSSAHIDGAYVGYPDGTFVHVVTLDGDDRWRTVLGAPENARRAVRIIETAKGERRSRWRFLDASGLTLRETDLQEARYDPRTRPWYKTGVGRPAPLATAPYTTATTGSLAVTVVQAHEARQSVVIGLDIRLDTIGRFLAEERISPGSRAFILDENGALIIHSDPAVMASIAAPREENDDSSSVADVLAEAARGADLPEGEARVLTAEGRPYLAWPATADVLPLLRGDKIVVAAPISELTADADRALKQEVAISVVVLALGAGAALFLARLVTKALQALTHDVERLQHLDFETPIKVRSHIEEISTLAGAMAMAREAIHTFALYVPRELVRRIVEAGQFTERSARRQEVTALFTDIYDFTTISERHPPEDVVAMLSGYFDIFSEVVEAHNGAIIQFLGDSVFAMWNAPIADPHHAENACRAALALKARVDRFNREQSWRGLPELRTRYGIHTGPAVVGSVGARERLQYTGMGDTLNVASRLEGLNKQFGTTILVSGAVKALCPPELRFRALGKAEAKGRKESIELFELVEAAEASA